MGQLEMIQLPGMWRWKIGIAVFPFFSVFLSFNLQLIKLIHLIS